MACPVSHAQSGLPLDRTRAEGSLLRPLSVLLAWRDAERTGGALKHMARDPEKTAALFER